MTTSAVSSTDPTTDTPPRRRRWIPLSLRIVGVMLVLLGVGCAWGCLSLYRQVTLRSDVKRLGGWLHMSWVGPYWLHSLVGPELSDKLRRVNGFELSGATITDNELARLVG